MFSLSFRHIFFVMMVSSYVFIIYYITLSNFNGFPSNMIKYLFYIKRNLLSPNSSHLPLCSFYLPNYHKIKWLHVKSFILDCYCLCPSSFRASASDLITFSSSLLCSSVPLASRLSNNFFKLYFVIISPQLLYKIQKKEIYLV